MCPVGNHADDYLSGPSNTIAPGPVTPFKIFDYKIPANQANIDTLLHGPNAGLFPLTFDILEFWIIAQTNQAAGLVVLDLTLNNDNTAIYDTNRVRNINSAVDGGTSISDTRWQVFAHAGANYPGILRCTIPGYSVDGGFNKIGEMTEVGADAAVGGNYMAARGMGYRDPLSKPITRLKVAAQGANLLKTNSRVIVRGL